MSETAIPEPQPVLKGFLFAFLAVVLWSGNFIIARGLHQQISPVSLSFYRWFLATLFFLPVAWNKVRTEWKALLPHKSYLVLTALAGVTIFNTLVYVAGHFTTAINLSLIGTTASPVFVFIIAAVFLKQSLSRFQIAGMFLCIAGILILLSKGDPGQLSRFRFTAGDLWILAAALSFAIYTLLVRKMPAHLSPIVFVFAIFLLGTLFLLPAFFVDCLVSPPVNWNGPLVGSLLYLGIGASVIAFLSWNISIRYIGPAKTALFGNLIPVFSSIEAAVILNESLTPVAVISYVVILAGILLANFSFVKTILQRI